MSTWRDFHLPDGDGWDRTRNRNRAGGRIGSRSRSDENEEFELRPRRNEGGSSRDQTGDAERIRNDAGGVASSGGGENGSRASWNGSERFDSHSHRDEHGYSRDHTRNSERNGNKGDGGGDDGGRMSSRTGKEGFYSTSHRNHAEYARDHERNTEIHGNNSRDGGGRDEGGSRNRRNGDEGFKDSQAYYDESGPPRNHRGDSERNRNDDGGGAEGGSRSRRNRDHEYDPHAYRNGIDDWSDHGRDMDRIRSEGNSGVSGVASGSQKKRDGQHGSYSPSTDMERSSHYREDPDRIGSGPGCDKLDGGSGNRRYGFNGHGQHDLKSHRNRVDSSNRGNHEGNIASTSASWKDHYGRRGGDCNKDDRGGKRESEKEFEIRKDGYGDGRGVGESGRDGMDRKTQKLEYTDPKHELHRSETLDPGGSAPLYDEYGDVSFDRDMYNSDYGLSRQMFNPRQDDRGKSDGYNSYASRYLDEGAGYSRAAFEGRARRGPDDRSSSSLAGGEGTGRDTNRDITRGDAYYKDRLGGGRWGLHGSERKRDADSKDNDQQTDDETVSLRRKIRDQMAQDSYEMKFWKDPWQEVKQDALNSPIGKDGYPSALHPPVEVYKSTRQFTGALGSNLDNRDEYGRLHAHRRRGSFESTAARKERIHDRLTPSTNDRAGSGDVQGARGKPIISEDTSKRDREQERSPDGVELAGNIKRTRQTTNGSSILQRGQIKRQRMYTAQTSTTTNSVVSSAPPVPTVQVTPAEVMSAPKSGAGRSNWWKKTRVSSSLDTLKAIAEREKVKPEVVEEGPSALLTASPPSSPIGSLEESAGPTSASASNLGRMVPPNKIRKATPKVLRTMVHSRTGNAFSIVRCRIYETEQTGTGTPLELVVYMAIPGKFTPHHHFWTGNHDWFHPDTPSLNCISFESEGLVPINDRLVSEAVTATTKAYAAIGSFVNAKQHNILLFISVDPLVPWIVQKRSRSREAIRMIGRLNEVCHAHESIPLLRRLGITLIPPVAVAVLTTPTKLSDIVQGRWEQGGDSRYTPYHALSVSVDHMERSDALLRTCSDKQMAANLVSEIQRMEENASMRPHIESSGILQYWSYGKGKPACLPPNVDPLMELPPHPTKQRKLGGPLNHVSDLCERLEHAVVVSKNGGNEPRFFEFSLRDTERTALALGWGIPLNDFRFTNASLGLQECDKGSDEERRMYQIFQLFGRSHPSEGDLAVVRTCCMLPTTAMARGNEAHRRRLFGKVLVAANGAAGWKCFKVLAALAKRKENGDFLTRGEVDHPDPNYHYDEVIVGQADDLGLTTLMGLTPELHQSYKARCIKHLIGNFPTTIDGRSDVRRSKYVYGRLYEGTDWFDHLSIDRHSQTLEEPSSEGSRRKEGCAGGKGANVIAAFDGVVSARDGGSGVWGKREGYAIVLSSDA